MYLYFKYSCTENINLMINDRVDSKQLPFYETNQKHLALPTV